MIAIAGLFSEWAAFTRLVHSDFSGPGGSHVARSDDLDCRGFAVRDSVCFGQKQTLVSMHLDLSPCLRGERSHVFELLSRRVFRRPRAVSRALSATASVLVSAQLQPGLRCERCDLLELVLGSLSRSCDFPLWALWVGMRMLVPL